MNIAIIPARAGSKRILKKNSKLFFGKPIISYPLEILTKSKLFNDIFVTSDDIKLINYINKYFPNIKTIIREKRYSTDEVKTITVVKNFIKKNLKKSGIKYICCVYPTTPLLKVKNLKFGLNICNKNKNFVFPVLKSSYKKGKFIELKHNTISKVFFKNNSEKNKFADAGQFYWGTYNNWIKKKKIIDKFSNCFVLKDYEAVDINTHQDWNRAKKFYKEYK